MRNYQISLGHDVRTFSDQEKTDNRLSRRIYFSIILLGRVEDYLLGTTGRMNNLLPPPPPRPSPNANGAFSIAQIHGKRRASSSSSDRVYGWEIIQPADASQIPCQRSLHAGAVWRDYFVVFGGYDGLHRVNDLHAFHFPTSTWRSLNRHNAPSPRDRHVAVVYDNSLYIFGGFDGSTRVNGNCTS